LLKTTNVKINNVKVGEVTLITIRTKIRAEEWDVASNRDMVHAIRKVETWL